MKNDPDALIPDEKPGAVNWMARNHVAATLMMLLFMIGGLMAIPSIRQEVFPEFNLDIITVTVPYPGASPSEIEQGIVLAVEEAVEGLDGVERITSFANEGSARVTVEFFEGTESTVLLQDIKNAVDRITTFPEEAEEPVVSLVVHRRDIISIYIYGDVDEDVLRQLSEMARDDLVATPEISLVTVGGVRPLEISIEVAQERLRAHGLTMQDIARRIGGHSLELSAGGIKTRGGEVLLRTRERRDYGREFADIPIVTRDDGTILRLGEIATIKDSFEDVDTALYFNGKRAVSLTIYRAGNETPLTISAKVLDYVEQLRRRLPPGIGVSAGRDFSEIYRDRVKLLLKNAGIGLCLVMLVLGMFLEVRLAFWVMLGIPTSFLGSLLFLPYCGVSINMISLFAFIITLGIVVDDAIVVGESFYYYRQQGLPFMRAAVIGAQIVAVPVIFSIITNMTTFLPMMFIPGAHGKFFRNIPIVVILVFSISLVEALFILPSHLGGMKETRGWFWQVVETPQRCCGNCLEWFVKHCYAPFLRLALDYRGATLATGIALLVIVFALFKFGYIKNIHFPYVEGDQVRVEAVLPYGTPVETTRKVMDRLRQAAEKVLATHGGREVTEGIFASINASHETQVSVLLVPLGERKFKAQKFKEEWREAIGYIAGLESLTFRARIGPSQEKPINLELSHPDLTVLDQAAAEVAAALETYDGVTEIDDGVTRGKMQLDFKLTPLALSQGLTSGDLARQVRYAFFGVQVKRQQRGRNEIKIYVRLPGKERRSEQDVEQLMLRTPGGGEIPLTDAARLIRSRAYESIKRVDGQRMIDVTADVTRTANANEILQQFQRTGLNQVMDRYPGLRVSLEGEQRERRKVDSSLSVGFGIIMIVLFAMLAIPFRSYLQALMVLVAIPFGIVGSVVGHLIMGYDISMVSRMGMVALAGVVINDNILLVDTANNYIRQGFSLRKAIELAPIRRFRPVLLTSLTTFFGLMPMILEKSVQARFLIPMALSLGYGIVFSTTISLLLVPALFLMVGDLKRWMGYPVEMTNDQ